MYASSARRGNLGVTTAAVVLLVYLMGGLIYWDQTWLASALGIIVTVLLALRPTLHRLVARIKREDIYAALKLAVVSAVVLPLLPNQAYGPLGVLNPYRIWLIAVFVSAVGFSGHVGIKLLGPRKGIRLTALLGGLIFSTAVTLDFSQRRKETPSLGRYLALGIILASNTMYPIIILRVLAFNSSLAQQVGLPMALLTALVPEAVSSSGGLPAREKQRTRTLSTPFVSGQRSNSG